MFRRPKRQRETVDLQFDNGNLTLAHDGETHDVASPASVTANTTAIATNATAIQTKASGTDLASLQNTVSTKADQNALDSLQTTVNTNTTTITNKITDIQESGGTMTGMKIDGTEYTLGGGASTLGELTDVSASSPADGQALVYQTGQWGPGTAGTAVVANPSTNPTIDLTKVSIGGTDFNVGSGTAVVANPSTTPTIDLTKVTIGSTHYNVGSGTAVVANPSDTPSTDLTKVTIGSTNFYIYEEGTVQVKVTSAATVNSSLGSIVEPDVNDTFTLSYQRLGSYVDLIGAFSIDGTIGSNGVILGRIGLEFVSPPAWLVLQADPTFGSGTDHGTTFVVGQLTTSHLIDPSNNELGHGYGPTGDVQRTGSTTFQVNFGTYLSTSGDPNKMSLHMRCRLA